MKKFRYLLPAAVICLSWVLLIGQVEVKATTGPMDSPNALAKAHDMLQRGQFQDGFDLLGQLPKGDLPAADAKITTLTKDYLAASKSAAEERAWELSRAVERVKLARLAQARRDKLADKDKTDEDIYKKVQAVAEAIGSADKLVNNATSQPADIRKTALDSVARAGKEAQAALALAPKDGPWTEAMTKAATSLRTALDDYAKLWEKAALPQDWRKLKLGYDKVQSALVDMGVLVAREPQFVALSHAREARELSPNAEEFLKQDWVKQLVSESEKLGQVYIAAEKWNDALGIYGRGGLSDIDENSEQYKSLVKQITQHVRMINLYGRSGTTTSAAAGGSTSKPADDGDEDEPRWREMIVGIDATMIRNAISQIDDNYVDVPDYRKMGQAALESLKILATTPQAAKSFSVLSDADKVKAFVEGAEKEMDQIKKKTMVDHLDLDLALNHMIDLNAATLKLPDEIICMEFAEGMLGELDQFSSMIWPYEKDDFRKKTMGQFYGIGVQIRKDPGKYIEVVTPLPDTPAFKAGIRAGDAIMKIDGKDTKNMSVDNAVKTITGPKNSKVLLTIQRPGEAAPLEVAVERDEIHIQTVKGWRNQPDGRWDFMIDPDNKIGYIRLTQFTQDSHKELQDAIKAVKAAGSHTIILDLRFDPGGLLTSAAQIADEFTNKGVIVSTKGRSVRETSMSAKGDGAWQEGKLIVMVNRYSASAAEILSGALKDWKRAVIVGERSYGKGSVQQLIPLRPKRAELKLTTAHYYLPSGRCLHRVNGAKEWGVDPDVAVPVTVRQMNRYAEIRQETDLLKDVDVSKQMSLLDQQLQDDLELQTALLLGRLDVLTHQ